MLRFVADETFITSSEGCCVVNQHSISSAFRTLLNWPVLTIQRSLLGPPRKVASCSHDLATMPHDAYLRVAAGQPRPGVFASRADLPLGPRIDELLAIVECSEPDEWVDQVCNLPLFD